MNGTESRLDHLILSIDAMGGDHAPDIVIEGLSLFVKNLSQKPNSCVSLAPYQHIHFLVFGNVEILNPLIEKYSHLNTYITICSTTTTITADTKPSAALRTGRSSSMGQAIQAVKEGRAAGVISAGNTGAYMALALLELRPIPGIQRPAICAIMPTLRNKSVVLDLGATVDCDAQNLLQFAIMGELYAQEVLKIQNPSIGLLNIGSENTKGNTVVKEAARLFSETSSTHNRIKNFYGFVEGDDITKGTTDVVVTDGFSGNIALKAIEGTAKMIITFLKESFEYSLYTRLGFLLARSSLDTLLKKRLDPRYHNGALFLGINGVVIKSHGGTDSLGFSNAIQVAVTIIINQLNDKIKATLLQKL